MKTFLWSVAVVMVGSTVAASAGDPVYMKVVCHETVFVTQVKKVAYTKEVTRYDECGKPYCVKVVCFKEVVVTVPKVVEVVKLVKVCD